MEETALDRLELDQSAVICAIDAESGEHRRLLDLPASSTGQSETVSAQPVRRSKSLLFRGAVIALRNCDAQKIKIRRL